MKSVVISNAFQSEIIDKDAPTVKNGESVIVKVKCVGLSSQDTKGLRGESGFYPFIPGHEISGEVYEVGKNVADIKIGDRVVLEPADCQKQADLTYCGGGLQEYVLVDQSQCHKIPDDYSWDEAVFAVPLAIGQEVMERAQVLPNDFVLIYGADANGIIIMSLAKAIGATCIVADTVVDYLSLAKRVGADYTIDITTEDIEERVKAISGEMGPNVIVDCKGIPDFLNNAVNMVSFAGRIVCVRYCEKNQEYNTLWCSAKELSIIGLSRFNNEFRLVVKKLRNHLNVIRKLTADRFKFEHYQLALKRAVDEDPKSMKVLVDFD